MTHNELMKLIEETDFSVDIGLKPSAMIRSGEKREALALYLGATMAFQRLVQEGVVASAQIAHFMMHMQDYVARLYSGEKLLFAVNSKIGGKPVADQTMSVDSKLGDIYQQLLDYMLQHGKIATASDDEEGDIQITEVSSREELKELLNKSPTEGATTNEFNTDNLDRANLVVPTKRTLN